MNLLLTLLLTISTTDSITTANGFRHGLIEANPILRPLPNSVIILTPVISSTGITIWAIKDKSHKKLIKTVVIAGIIAHSIATYSNVKQLER